MPKNYALKKRYLKRIFLLILLSAVLADFFIFSAFIIKIPKGVTVDGVEVGGLTFRKGVAAVRAHLEKSIKPLQITGENTYVFDPSEIGFSDETDKVLKRAKRGEQCRSNVCYYLKDAYQKCAMICAEEYVAPCEPHAKFFAEGEPFSYVAGKAGKSVKLRVLLSDVKHSLNDGFTPVKITYDKVPAFTTMREVEYNTRLLSTYTTYFDGENESRVHNIALAASSINGKILERGDEFSFNYVVGARTERRGYKRAKIIEKGEFVDGIGGGVCQVSTTLYNAALLSGCEISEVHSHSLSVGYVPPAADAMVSGKSFDLKFKNVTGSRLYIRAKTFQNGITFDFYGRGDGAAYEFHSKTLSVIPSPVELTDDETKLKQGKSGAVCEGYLVIRRGKKSEVKLIRRVKYSPTKTILLSVPEGSDSNECDEPKNFAD